jgi:hemerythrin-like domain-containing protein
MKPEPTKFVELEGYHEDLRRLFARHQIALVRREYGEAIERLEQYEQALAKHLIEEETFLLPLLALRGKPLPGGDPQSFQADHRKLRSMLTALSRRVGTLRDAPSAIKLVNLIEHEGRFKSLFETHGAREASLLFPRLDQLTGATERLGILERCTTRAATGGALRRHIPRASPINPS